MIPFILQQERNETRTEIQDKCISVTYDGTTRQGEVLAVIVRFCVDWVVVQRLVRLHVLQKSMNAEELARELISVLSVMLGVKSDNLLGFMRDGASVNGAAMRTLSIMYPIAIDIRCLSHTLNLVGEKFKTPNLHLFITLWVSFFSHSAKVKALWKEQTGQAMPSFSATRWWSKWEIMNKILIQFGDMESFLRQQDIGTATHTKEMQPKAADLDALTAFPFLSQENLHHLKEELPVYLAKVVDISQSISLLEWWKDNSADLPFWSSAASKVILIQPSSAPAERVFSIMNRSFNDCQCNSLEDYIEASVMLQYNNRTNL